MSMIIGNCGKCSWERVAFECNIQIVFHAFSLLIINFMVLAPLRWQWTQVSLHSVFIGCSSCNHDIRQYPQHFYRVLVQMGSAERARDAFTVEVYLGSKSSSQFGLVIILHNRLISQLLIVQLKCRYCRIAVIKRVF